MDLLIRAGRNDHTIIDQFLAPATSGLLGVSRQPIGGVVADATVAVERPQLSRLTKDAGVPYLVDPLTPLLQTQQSPSDKWCRLRFGQAEPVAAHELNDYLLEEIVERVIESQREAGATHLIPPYFYLAKTGDSWWSANIAILARTGHYLEKHNVDLPVVPVFAASLREYGPRVRWAKGLDAYLDATRSLNVEAVALSWSWSDPPKPSEAALSLLLAATSHAASKSNVIGWRSGLYGLAMSAAGASGYETGIGARESLHYVALANARKPKAERSDEYRTQAYVYLSPFGRSLPRRAGRALLANSTIAGSIVCDPDNFCCFGGADSQIGDWRQHAIRERARELQQLESMPRGSAWRMHHIEQRAERASMLAETANQVLERADVTLRIPASTFTNLERVASRMREGATERVA